MSNTRKTRGKRKARQRRNRRILLIALCALCLLGAALLLVPRPGASGPRPQALPGETPILRTVPEIPEAPAPTGIPEPLDTPVPTPSPSLTPSPSPSPSPTPVPTPTPQRKPVKLDYPYCMVVDRGKQVVTVYTVGETGAYDVVVRQMICSTDKYNRKPGNGIYKLDGERKRWLSTLADTYAQYATRISGTILFHSVPYKKKNPSKLDTKEYGKLGTNASIGCIRLTCEDAKWIYENVPKNTLVRFMKGEYDQALLDSLRPPELVGGKWDPTDDNPKNPDYIGGTYHTTPDGTPCPGITPRPTSHKIKKWRSKGNK